MQLKQQRFGVKLVNVVNSRVYYGIFKLVNYDGNVKA